MDPLTIASIAAFLGGGFFRDNSGSDLLKMAGKVANPEQLNLWQDMLYRMYLSSPAFTSAKGSLVRGGQSAAAATRASLAERGLSSSGIGTLTNAVGQSLPAIGIGNLHASGWQNAGQGAMDLLRMKLGAAGSLPAPSNMGAGLYGAGLNALSLLLSRRMPQQGAGQTSNGWSPMGGFGATPDYFSGLTGPAKPWMPTPGFGGR